MKIERIESEKQLEWCFNQLKPARQLAVDLEFDKNRYRYGFQLCLMQIAANDTCYIIDPLTEGVSVKKLFPLFEDPDIEKVVFAFGEDLRLLHTMGCFPRGLYDLRSAISLLNYPPASLTNLLDEILGVQVAKSAQNSNWFLRPLTDDQIEYAADDVRHLAALKNEVEKEAKTKGISEWIAEENKFAEEQDFADTADNEVFRAKDKIGHSQYSWYVLESLLHFREQLAKDINRPSFQVIHKDYLNELTLDPSALEKWYDVRGIHRAVKNEKTRKQLQAVLSEARLAAAEKQLSESDDAIPRLSVEELKERRRKSAEAEKVKQEVFLPVKKQIVRNYGENAATFMLSNRAISDILYGHKVQHLRPYKRKLLLKYAEELNLNIGEYL